MEFREYVAVLRARKATVFVSIVLFVIAAVIVDVMRPATYVAESRVLVSQTDPVSSLLGVVGGGVPQADRDMATHAELVRSPEVSASVVKRLSLKTTPEAVASRVIVEPVGGSDLLAIRATDTDPGRAASIANAFAAGYVDLRLSQVRSELERARAALGEQRDAVAARVASLDKRVRTGGAAAQAQRDAAVASLAEIDAQSERLATGSAIDLVGTRVVVAASPQRAAGSGSLVTTLLVGLALGLAVGVGAAFTGEHFDTRLRTAADASALGLRVVGALPGERHVRGASSLTMLREPSSPGSDAYRLLRRVLQGTGAPGGRVIAVTTPAGAAGPPTVAANLALALAQAGDRVTLIDCDLRRSPVQGLFGLQGNVGLSDVLTGARQLPEASQRPVHQRLTVVAGGAAPPAPGELLGARRMQQVVIEAAALSDVVVLSAPPLLESADASAVLDWADRLLLVVRAGETRREQVRHALELLGRIGLGLEAEAVLLGVADGGGLEAYLVSTPDESAQKAGGRLEALRPGEALAQ